MQLTLTDQQIAKYMLKEFGYMSIINSILLHILYSFVFLYGYKSPSTILTSTQIAFFFFIAKSANNIKFNLKTFSITAMRAILCRHLIPFFYSIKIP